MAGSAVGGQCQPGHLGSHVSSAHVSSPLLSHWLEADRGSLVSSKPARDFKMQQLELFLNELPATRNLRSAISQSPYSNVAGGTVA